MISTSDILSTGEKNWIPMKSSCRLTPLARPVIGRVEVLDLFERSILESGRRSITGVPLVGSRQAPR